MKKLISLLTAVIMLSGTAASAWEGAEEYDMRKQLVKGSELNVYVEGDTDSAPYYGARLEPRSGVYFGTLAEHPDILDDFSTCLTYIEFDSQQPDFYYPANETIRNNNVNVMLGWNVANADTIRNIDAYTDYIENTVQTIASYGKNVYVRFAGEMNDTELGNGEEYKYAFRKVADIVHRYDNLAMVWSPIALGSLLKPYADYYPGNEYVDWVGLSCYQIKYFTGRKDVSTDDKMAFMTDTYAWHTNSVKPLMKFMSEYGISKPVMISEGGVANRNVFGEDTSAWASLRLRNMYWDLIMKYPQVKMINYFNVSMDGETEFFNMEADSELAGIIRNAINSGAYIHRNSQNSFAFKEIQSSNTLVGPQVPIYAHAYAQGAEFIDVDYYIDGNHYGSNVYSPHNITINLNDISDGSHTLEVCSRSGDTIIDTKQFNFTKLGAFVRFGAGQIVNNKQINVSLNGNQITFDVPPCIIADRTLVPIRAFANALGISDNDIDYNGNENTVTIKNGKNTVKLYINNPDSYINGQKAEIDVPPTVIDGRTLVPLRFISENFNCSVDYTDSSDALNVFLTTK